MTYAEQINRTRVPRHIAIIMDGNGRWAKERGLDRSEGHRKGLDVVHEITDAAAEVGVQYLTLYAFSTENLESSPGRGRRPHGAGGLWYRAGDPRHDREGGCACRSSATSTRLPADVKARLLKCISDTSGGKRIVLNLALSYSSRWEIARAARCIAREVQSGALAIDDITESTLDRFMTTADMPIPRFAHQNGRRDTAQQFPVVATVVCRVLFHRRVLARLYGREPLQGHRRVSVARTSGSGKTSEQL